MGNYYNQRPSYGLVYYIIAACIGLLLGWLLA